MVDCNGCNDPEKPYGANETEMTRKKIVWIVFPLVAVTMIGLLLSVPRAYPSSSPPEYVPDEIIVRFKPNVRRTAVRNFGNRYNFSTLRRLASIEADSFKLPPGMGMKAALEILRRDTEVLYAEPNFYRYALKKIPNDPFFNKLWGLDNTGQVVNNTIGSFNADINAPEAWDLSTGSEVVIAVIDSGIDFHHPDLKNNLWENKGEIPGNGVDDDGNGYIDDVHGWNFTSYNPPGNKGNDNIIDSNYHGTHVSGVIAARGDNGLGTIGVCWNARIMTLKFLDAYGKGSISDEVAAIDYAIRNGAKIINASFGDFQFSNAEADAVGRAERAGILFVSAAGNDGNNNDSNPLYPASYRNDNIISVAASDQQDNLAEWSNFGFASVDIVAPGVNIYAPQPGREIVWSENFDDDLEGSWTLTPPWSHLWPTANRKSVYSGNGSLTSIPESADSATYASAVSPAVALGNRFNSRLVFYLKRRSDQGRDKLFVEIATRPEGPWNTRTIEILIPHLGTSVIYENGIGDDFIDWREAIVDIGNLDNLPTAYFRFKISAAENPDMDQDGWYIDEATISSSATNYNGPETDYYRYLSGTSTATPFVSGVAGLIWSRYPELTYCQVKSAILNGGDIKSSLDGQISYDRRVNAWNSLTLAADPLSLPSTCSNKSDDAGGGDSGAPCFIHVLGSPIP